jgi:hypothetical protein
VFADLGHGHRIDMLAIGDKPRKPALSGAGGQGRRTSAQNQIEDKTL